MSSNSPLRFEDDGTTVHVLIASDITLHRREMNNQNSLPKKIFKAIKGKKSGRAYTKEFKVEDGGRRIKAFFPFTEEDIKRLQKFREQGRDIKFLIPKKIPFNIEN